MLEQYAQMLELYGTHTGVNLARKHIGWYTKGLPGSAELRNQVNQQDDPAMVIRMLRDFYSPWLVRPPPESRNRQNTVCFLCNGRATADWNGCAYGRISGDFEQRELAAKRAGERSFLRPDGGRDWGSPARRRRL
jgi:hypothetical protein